MWIFLPGSTFCLSAPGSEDSTSESGSLAPGLERCATSSGNTRPARYWRRVCKTAASIPHPSGWMPDPSTVERGVEQWISSLRGSPARAILLPASDYSATIPATSGRHCGPSFGMWDPATSSWKTCQASLFPELNESSPLLLPGYSESWPKTGGMRNGRCFRRRKWAPRTDAIASGCWPTPHGIANTDHTGKRAGPSANELGYMAGMWATPNAHDGRRPGADEHSTQGGNLNRDASLWQTPTTQDAHNNGPASQEARHSPPLNAQANLWSTPRASDGDKGGPNQSFGAGGTPLPAQAASLWMTPAVPNGGRMGARTETGREGQERALEHQSVASLSSLQAQPTATSGEPSSVSTPGSPQPRPRLDPCFVEWLQGLPTGWTSRAPISSEDWETWRSLCARQLRSFFFGSDCEVRREN